jgi:hypothetical protein
MTNSSRLPVIGILVVGALAFAAPSSGQNRAPVSEAIAKAYGFDAFSQIDQIRYTFHIPERSISRTWVWEPKTDQVSFEGKNKAGQPVKVTYRRSEIAGQPSVVKDEIDPSFINDQYWLVFPFHLVWDSSAKVEETGMHPLLLGKGSARRIVVTYPQEGGYTPGDTWELFVGPDNRIQEWAWHKASSPEPTGIWSWEDHKQAGPLLLSLNHHGKGMDGKPLRVFFTDVAVKLMGETTTWAKAR